MSTGPIDRSSLADLLLHSKVVPLALADGDRLVFANDGFRHLLGGTEAVVGHRIFDLFAPSEHDRIAAALRACGRPEGMCVAAAIRPDGSSADIELRFDSVTTGHATLVAAFAQDVTARLRADAQCSLAARRDRITGLANRATFTDRLHQATLTARRTGTPFAVLKLDLDESKSIRGRLGHAAGDTVLQRAASRLLAVVRDTDTVARLAGGEFGVLLPGVNTRQAAADVALRLIEALRQPLPAGGQDVAVGVSVGIALFPEHAGAADELLSAAEAALYAARRDGHGRLAWAAPASLSNVTPAPLTWSAAHELGIAMMDEQHAAMAARLNALGQAMRNGEDPLPFLEDAQRYTAFHFASEEQLMRDHAYAGIDLHRDLHRLLLADLHRLPVRAGGVGLALRYLQEWLVRHVDGADRDLAETLRQRGVS